MVTDDEGDDSYKWKHDTGSLATFNAGVMARFDIEQPLHLIMCEAIGRMMSDCGWYGLSVHEWTRGRAAR